MNPWGRLAKRHSRLSLVLLASLVTLLLAWVVFSGPAGQWWRLHEQVGQVGRGLIAMEQAVSQQKQVEAQCRQFEQRILARGTDAEESGLLLKELETLTRAANVKVKSIRSMPSQRMGSYRKFVVSLELETRVNGLLELLYAIDSSAKILTVESLALQALRTGPNLLDAAMVVSRTTSGEGRAPPPASTSSEVENELDSPSALSGRQRAAWQAPTCWGVVCLAAGSDAVRRFLPCPYGHTTNELPLERATHQRPGIVTR